MVLLAWSVMRSRRRPASTGELAAGGAQWPWLLADRGLLSVAGALAGIGVLALMVMLNVAADVNSAAERAKLQIEAIKYGLGSIAAGGAAAALLLAVRRQRHAEQVHEHTVDDAAERRVTDLYTKAAEQLGHADAAVRLAGLYAFERVAQNSPKQRQTIVNVLCAYLRMPYAPPADPKAAASASAPVNALPLAVGQSLSADDRNPHQELQVRLTAQRILSSHLSLPDNVDSLQAASISPDPHERYWPDIDLDLTGATLVNWTLRRGQVRNASFVAVAFNGVTWFSEATFTGDTRFHEATFNGDAWFSEATFNGDPWFHKVTFRGDAGFNNATFNGSPSFGKATFNGEAMFNEATFTGTAWFSEATFNGDAGFHDARFKGSARFHEVATNGDVWFRGAAFSGTAGFAEATFNGQAGFSEATFNDVAWFREVTFNDVAWFREVTFNGRAGFNEATFRGDARFDEATFVLPPVLEHAFVTLRDDREDTWPPGWRPVLGPSVGRLTRAD
ncbi:pentapeptide repeat-containing protein [Micromonospora lupini]|uniref:pentapeptide repeat-containing protein n=1 Tax=Micromonospora lupini TaxID=285679 RepID=UPI0031DC3297